jgi:hypothetical protein
MSKMGQIVQSIQEGQPEPMEPDPLYDEREMLKEQMSDPGYDEFNQKHCEPKRKVKW